MHYLPLAIAISMAVLATVADVLLKRASGCERPWMTVAFSLGLLLYASTAFGWVYAMQHFKLATIGVTFAVTNVLLLALMGYIVFGESLTPREITGVLLGLASLSLLARVS